MATDYPTNSQDPADSHQPWLATIDLASYGARLPDYRAAVLAKTPDIAAELPAGHEELYVRGKAHKFAKRKGSSWDDRLQVATKGSYANHQCIVKRTGVQ